MEQEKLDNYICETVLRLNSTPAYINNKETIFNFIIFFSRFEFSLKRLGCTTTRENGEVLAFWDKYAQRIQHIAAEQSQNTIEDTLTQDAVFNMAKEYINSNKPRILKINQTSGGLTWENDDSDDLQSNSKRILDLIRRIRNNLFHGEKFLIPGEMGEDRDIILLKAGMAIMQGYLKHDQDLRSKFFT